MVESYIAQGSTLGWLKPEALKFLSYMTYNSEIGINIFPSMDPMDVLVLSRNL